MLNILKDKNGDTSSRIVFNAIILLTTLGVCLYCIYSQKDIPSNALYLFITIITGYVPASTITQYLQNIKEREIEENRDINGNGKIGE